MKGNVQSAPRSTIMFVLLKCSSALSVYLHVKLCISFLKPMDSFGKW